ncbi:MAG: IS982 family transposase, partial [Muribaculaceae bacterium]|nr:IS982 family transposase [Muribaculaceae bacterium]MBQ6078937.1 IS982 family transposase [Muribaculaceae bacterium]MBQ6079611.1 IS982 family transposase [Muribaculaceae bacterium]MBQ6079933.1 IS982 family transposase [Muribaculaceae bacterium]
MFKKLRISLIYSNLVVIKTLNSNHRMHNLYANFVRI